MITCTTHLDPCLWLGLWSNFLPLLMPAAFEDNNNLVVPPLNTLVHGFVFSGKRLVWWKLSLENTLTITLLMPVNKG